MAPAIRSLCIVLVVVAALLMLSAQAGTSGSWSQAMAGLEDEIRLLQNRLERLEARAGRQDPRFLDGGIDEDDPPASPRSTAAASQRIMRLEGIENVEPDPQVFQELERLQKEADAMEQTVDNTQRRVNSMVGGNGSGGYRSRTTKQTGESRQRRAESEMLAEYQKNLRQKRGEAKRLEREIGEPKQIIVGRMGNKVITLETTRDLSRVIDRLSLGDYLTWEGRRSRADNESQEWVVTSIQPAEAPE